MSSVMEEANNTEFYKELYETLYSKCDYHLPDSLYTTHYINFFPNTLKRWKVKFTSVLDIGCSHGEGMSYLKSHGKEVHGLDVSITAVNRAIKKGVNAKVCSATNIDFPDNFVDLITSTDVIEHLYPDDAEKCFREMFRVTKKYAVLNIANTPEGNSYYNKLKSANMENPPTHLHLTVRKYTDWIKFIENLNLEWKVVNSIKQNRYNNTIIMLEKTNDYEPTGDIITFDDYKNNYMDYGYVFINENEKQLNGDEPSLKIKNEIYTWGPNCNKEGMSLKVTTDELIKIHSKYNHHTPLELNE